MGSRKRSRESVWPAGAQAAVTFSFDDGYVATYEATTSHLQDRSVCATYNVITGHTGDVFEGLPTATWSQWQCVSRMGHEIASHSATHTPQAGPLSDLWRLLGNLRVAPDRPAYVGQLLATAHALSKRRRRARPTSYRRPGPSSTSELAASRLHIDRIISDPPTESFAYPAGRHNAVSRRAVVNAGFKSARTLDAGLNDARSDPFALRAVVLGPGATVDDLVIWLERAYRSSAWLIVVFHLVAEHNPTGYPYFCPLSEFQRLLDTVQSQPFWIATQRQIVRYLAAPNATGSTS